MIPDGMDAIPGWFWPTDVALFDWFLTQQDKTGLAGDLAEIGPYLGKSAVLIGSHLGPGEHFTVIDLFEEPAEDSENERENRSSYGGVSQAAFEANYRQVLGRLPQVIRGQSARITDFAQHGTHRFVHVDASHLYEHVAVDIQSSRTLLRRDGVVVFDDIRAVHTPGVWAAVWEAVVRENLIPIVVSEHKLYATWGEFENWQRLLIDATPDGLVTERQYVLGRPLIRASTPAAPVEVPTFGQRVQNAVVPPVVLARAHAAKAAWRARAARNRPGAA